MLELAVAAALSAAILTPHLVPLERTTPLWAATVWGSALALRAFASIGLAVFTFVSLPQTEVFRVVAQWCWHDVLPLLALHLGFSGDPVAHVASILPGLVLAGSLLSLAAGLARAWLALRRRLARPLGAGPRGSTIIEGEEILVAATRLGRGRVVLSDAALRSMDSDELAASLAHEEAHLRRRHRPLLLAGSLFAALGSGLPGTRVAQRELAFQLERDADEVAVRETRDPLALASAICKTATDAAAPVLVALGGRGRVARRLGYLVDSAPSRGGLLLEGATRLLAVALTLGALTLAVSVPAWATSVPVTDGSAAAHCPH